MKKALRRLSVGRVRVINKVATTMPIVVCGSRRLDLDKKNKPDQPVVGVIVSVCSGQSYDSLFTSIPQKAPTGRVSVFWLDMDDIFPLYRRMVGQPVTENKLLDEILEDVKSVPADCVVFNWECCSGCLSGHFPNDRNDVAEIMKHLLDHGHMVMLSDWSLSALIADWSSRRLGPNPFKNLGTFQGAYKLRFDPKILQQCPSSQLVTIAKICESGEATLNATLNTLIYTVDPDVIESTDAYQCEVLTLANNFAVPSQPYESNLCLPDIKNPDGSEIDGVAGHVLLTYPSGGRLFTSCGHWIELTHISVSKEKFVILAESIYGKEFHEHLGGEAGTPDATENLQQMATLLVQQTSPANYAV
eukprot:TRINITY_DN3864_c0_g2_i2.p1 TRINITY_DN3864_c0_g2~~TRINITY_DN3864_c0_g2_i2.p1  ORF type:complete len:360 (+),score=74.09 TRINITY_DN3864_c0_g2_i2:84-1163(+)